MKRLIVVIDPGDRGLGSVFDILVKERVKREYQYTTTY